MAKHYGVEVAVCPPRRAQRKGVVEAAIKYITKSWWRTAAVTTHGEAQASLDRWCVRGRRPAPAAGRHRRRARRGRAAARAAAGAYPAVIAVERKASRSALVAFEANHYSVPPAHAGRTVTVVARVGEPVLRILSAAGEVLAEHRRAPAGGRADDPQPRARRAAASRRSWPRSPPTTPAGARPTGRRATGRWPSWRELSGLEPSPAPVISLERYARLAEVAC